MFQSFYLSLFPFFGKNNPVAINSAYDHYIFITIIIGVSFWLFDLTARAGAPFEAGWTLNSNSLSLLTVLTPTFPILFLCWVVAPLRKLDNCLEDLHNGNCVCVSTWFCVCVHACMHMCVCSLIALGVWLDSCLDIEWNTHTFLENALLKQVWIYSFFMVHLWRTSFLFFYSKNKYQISRFSYSIISFSDTKHRTCRQKNKQKLEMV